MLRPHRILLVLATAALLAPRGVAAEGAAAGDLVSVVPDVAVTVLQVGWFVLLVLLLPLAARVGRLAGTGRAAAVGVFLLAAVVSLLALRDRPPIPIHNNGHSWREARELLSPLGVRDIGGMNPYYHGRGGLALLWLGMPSPAGLGQGAAGDPLEAARVPMALAAGSTALLALLLTSSSWAGALAGVLAAIHPLSLLLGSSGSTLSATAFALPLSLALLVAAKRSPEPLLLGAAILAALLATTSHSAAIFWPFALVAAWLLLPGAQDGRPADRRALLVGCVALAAAWTAQAIALFRIASGSDLPRAAQAVDLASRVRYLLPHRVILFDPAFSAAVLGLLCLLAAVPLRRGAPPGAGAAALAACLLASAPFLASSVSVSDPERYQGALVGLVSALAAAGVARASALLGRSVGPALALLWLVSIPPVDAVPVEPYVLEHEFLGRVLPDVPAGTLVVLPPRTLGEMTYAEFPDWLVPPGVTVARTGTPLEKGHVGPRLAWAGLACISWPLPGQRPQGAGRPGGMRTECRELLAGLRPWRTMTLSPADIPRLRDGRPWTFWAFETGERFGLFRPRGAGE